MNKPEFDPRFASESFTEGKNPPRNEDHLIISKGVLVLSDGETDRTGIKYDQNPDTGSFRTGGDVAADIATRTTTDSHLNGRPLVEAITLAFQAYYRQHNPRALSDSSARFAATLAVARVVDEKIVFTLLGDSYIRINGRDVYSHNKEVDNINGQTRRKKIEQLASHRPNGTPTMEDVAAGREAIMDRLKTQHLLNNKTNDPLGYGLLDGAPVPEQFITTFETPIADIQTIEIVSDGYFGQFPEDPTVQAYEALHREIEQTDPYKYKQYLSTKASDDRTIAILRRKLA